MLVYLRKKHFEIYVSFVMRFVVYINIKKFTYNRFISVSFVQQKFDTYKKITLVPVTS